MRGDAALLIGGRSPILKAALAQDLPDANDALAA